MRKNHIPIAVLSISLTLFFTACSSPQLEVESTEELTDQTEMTVEIVTMEPPVEVVQPTATLEEPSS